MLLKKEAPTATVLWGDRVGLSYQTLSILSIP